MKSLSQAADLRLPLRLAFSAVLARAKLSAILRSKARFLAAVRSRTRLASSLNPTSSTQSGLTHVISHLKAALKRGTSTCPFSRLLSQFANLKCMRLARLLTLSPLTTPCTLSRLITCVSPDGHPDRRGPGGKADPRGGRVRARDRPRQPADRPDPGAGRGRHRWG